MAELRARALDRVWSVISSVSGNPRARQLLFNAIRLDRPQLHRLWVDDELRFMAYAFAHRQRSRSQILQDLFVSWVLDEQREGYYVDFGATDGVTNSNSHLLAHDFGWTGILAEPNPHWHTELARHRPQDAIDHRCVFSRSGETVSFVTSDEVDPELSGIAAFGQGDHFADVRRRSARIEVETISLTDLLVEHGAPPVIDYVSIDTEGSELEILTAFDFDRFHPRVITVEQNSATERGLSRLLQDRGYVQVFPRLSQWDSWYVDAELAARPLPQLHTPSA